MIAIFVRSIEIPFGDRDQYGDYTLQVDDIVEFNIATDRRDKLERATNIQLSEDTFIISKEKREKVLLGCYYNCCLSLVCNVVLEKKHLIQDSSHL